MANFRLGRCNRDVIHVDAWLSTSGPSAAPGDGRRTADEEETELEFELVDLSLLSIGELSDLDDSAFAHCLRRVVGEPGDVVAGFQSAV